MGFRVVDKSSVVFETDLCPSSRIIHPSGVIHAFRTDVPTSESTGTDENVFAWIPNSLKVNKILAHLEKRGFHRSHGIVFIPYSTKENWTRWHPNAPLSLECTEEGKVLTCPTEAAAPDQAEPEGGGGGEVGGVEESLDAMPCNSKSRTLVLDDGKRKKRIFKVQSSMVGDLSLLPDDERDELHVEIYNYLSWLLKRVEETEEKERAASAPQTEVGVDGEGGEEESNEDNNEEDDDEADCKATRGMQRDTGSPHVNVPELRGALEKLKSSLYVLPNVQNERFRIQARDGTEEAAPEERPDPTRAPFLEEALRPGALSERVAARVRAGKPRRRCRQKTLRKPWKPRIRKRFHAASSFEAMLERLEGFHEEHGHSNVGRHAREYPELSAWVNDVRNKRRKLHKRTGRCVEEVGRGRPLTAKMLTAERVGRLDAVGFVWDVLPPRVSWEERFGELTAYREENGRWPSQSAGRLGEWVRWQRALYAAKDESFMKNRASLLDEVGFEWTPKGYFRIGWDEGFEKLMEFFNNNGHFDVPPPAYGEKDKDGHVISKGSDAHKFYKWVESLHAMHRSFKLGRQSGSLTEERVSLLIKHGFKFRDE